MTEESLFLEYVGDSPWMRVLQYLIEGKDFDYTLTDMLNAEVSWGTLNQIVPKLLKLNMIIKTRKIGRATLYKLNQNHEAVKHLLGLYNGIIISRLQKMKEEELVAE